MSTIARPTRLPSWLEQAWLTRYLDRKLDGEESAWFEAYLLDKPELVLAIDDDNQLRDTLAIATTITTERLVAERRSELPLPDARNQSIETKFSKNSFSRNQLHRDNRAAFYRLAASFLIGIGSGGALLHLGQGPSRGIDSNPTRVVYGVQRSASGERIIVQNADSKSIYVLIEAPVPPGASDITLHVDGRPDQVLTSSEEGFASVLIVRSLFTSAQNIAIRYRPNKSGEFIEKTLSVPKEISH